VSWHIVSRLCQADVTAVIDYRVLVHAIGSPAVMAAQCAHLADLVERYAVSLHVTPEGAQEHLFGERRRVVRRGGQRQRRAGPRHH
jgi:hypothetical protein